MTPLAAQWSAGRSVVGLWCSLADGFVHEIAGHQRVDYVCTDLQHGLADLQVLPGLLLASASHGATPLVRTLNADPSHIGRVLDSGARGIIVPLIDDAAAARAAVEACRYPPGGSRSLGPTRASLVMGSTAFADLENVDVIPMIETASGLDNVDEIVRVDGVSAIYVGPSDLALALGFAPGSDDPRFETVLEDILRAAKAVDVPVGLHCANGKEAAQALSRGFRMATVSSDHATLRQELARRVDDAHRS